MVDSIFAKLELSPDTPAVGLCKGSRRAPSGRTRRKTKDWIGAAEKNYSPQLNELFAE